MRKIQNVAFFINSKVAQLSMDSGCEGDCIRLDECERLNIPIIPLDHTDTHIPTQEDGKSPLQILGKVIFQPQRDKISLQFEGYVTKNLQSPILCGAPFLDRNKIVQELHNRRIVINGKYFIEETSPFCPNPVPVVNTSSLTLSRVQFTRPGDSLELHIGHNLPDQDYIISPVDETSLRTWQPQHVKAVLGKITISNISNEAEYLDASVPIFKLDPVKPIHQFLPNNTEPSHFKKENQDIAIRPPDETLDKIDIDKSVPQKVREKLLAIHKAHSKVFDGDLRDGYNSFAGNFDVNFNFLNDVPPPINYGCVPSYNKPEDDNLLQAMIDRLESLNVVAKANSLDIIPRFASPCMLVKKNSTRNLKPGEYEKLPLAERIKYNRFVLCQNKLNDHVQKIPAKYNKLDDTIRMVGAYEFVITSDLTDSFWQRHITESKLPYFAFHSPFKGTYIFLRSTQGFLNQSEGLEEMLSCVLQECVAQGWCRIHADNIYVMAHTMEQAVENWKQVLDLLLKNNLKLSPKKTSCFPAKLDLLGWTKEGKFLVPDVHRQNCLEKAERPSTVKELRSFLGSYRTFYRCKDGIAFILGNLEKITSDKASAAKIEWTPSLTKEFNAARDEIKILDTIYLPKPEDQLVLTSDYSKKGICATLWAIVDEKFVVVARMSTKLEKAQEHLLPCEGEATAVYVAAKCPYFSSHILASKLKTIALLDSKPVVQAANLLKQGKFSSSKLINIVLTSISDLNMAFQHMSGKMGQNFADDHGSRNPIQCSDRRNCKVCGFVDDCSQLLVSQISFLVSEDQTIIGQIDVGQDNSNLVNEIIRGTKPIPFANRQAMKYLQDQDPILRRVRELLLAGEGPHPNEKLPVKRYLQKNVHLTIASDGCLVVTRLNKKFVQRTLIVIPEDISQGLLHGLHLNLSHPTPYQLMKAIDTRFFLLDRDKKIKQVWDECPLCQSVAKIPVEIHDFQPNQMPDHPGKSFTVDILRTCKKYIMVSMENFSGFLTTIVITSEKADALLEGLIQTINPFKASSPSLVTVRTDRAPGFKALKNRTAELKELGLDLDLGEAMNKNSNALVDRKMQELETEIKKLAPTHNFLSVKILAKSTSTVNEKIRNQGLSAKEILFSRDQYSHENLPLEDENISKSVMQERKLNNTYSAKSKAQIEQVASSANARKGQLVFLKDDGSKLKRRDLYLVTACNIPENTVTICKILNSFGNRPASIHPHNHSYKVKQTDIYLAPNQPIVINPEIIQSEWLWLDPADHVPLPLAPKYPTTPPDAEEQEFWVMEDPEEMIEPTADEDQMNDTLQEPEVVEIPTFDDNTEDISENRNAPEYEREVDVDENLVPVNAAENDNNDEDGPNIDESQSNSQGSSQIGDVEDNLETDREDRDGTEDSDPDDDDLINPNNLPVTGDRIIFWDPDLNCRVKATVTSMHRTAQAQWPGWRNIIADNAQGESSVNLDNASHGCVKWRYLNMVPQIDGNYTEENMTRSTPPTLNVSSHLQEFHLDESFEIHLESVPNLDVEPRNMFNNDDDPTHEPEPTTTITALNLEVPRNGNILPNRVYRLPDELPTRSYSQQSLHNHRRNREHHRRPAVPKFLKKLNPFKKRKN